MRAAVFLILFMKYIVLTVKSLADLAQHPPKWKPLSIHCEDNSLACKNINKCHSSHHDKTSKHSSDVK